jgi:hypothetical protein
MAVDGSGGLRGCGGLVPTARQAEAETGSRAAAALAAAGRPN